MFKSFYLPGGTTFFLSTKSQKIKLIFQPVDAEGGYQNIKMEGCVKMSPDNKEGDTGGWTAGSPLLWTQTLSSEIPKSAYKTLNWDRFDMFGEKPGLYKQSFA